MPGGYLVDQNGNAITSTNRLPVDAQLMGRKAKVVAGDYTTPLSVVAGGSTTVTITPPVGELWRIKGMLIYAPPPTGATSGTHKVEIRYLLGTVDVPILTGTSNFGDAIDTTGNFLAIATATNGKSPSTEQAQQAAILSAVTDSTTPLKIVYTNNTNVAQNGNLVIRIVREVEYIV